jgi:hypothetical protein
MPDSPEVCSIMGLLDSFWRSATANTVTAFIFAAVEVGLFFGVPTLPNVRWYLGVGFIAFVAFIGRALYIEHSKGEKPDIALVWDWTEDQKKMHDTGSTLNKHILVHNRSGEWVYNIRIHPIKLGREMTFDGINEIEPGKLHATLARWENASSLTVDYARFFAAPINEQAAQKKNWHYTKLHNRGLSNYFLKIPMRISYESSKRKWEYRTNFCF